MDPKLIRVAKKQLRQSMSQTLASLSTTHLESSSADIYKSVMKFSEYRHAKRLGVYLSMSSKEVQTNAIVEDALASGKDVYVPFIKPTGSEGSTKDMDMVQLRDLKDYKSLKRDHWDIPSLDASDVHDRKHVLRDRQALDLLLVPGMAFQKCPETDWMKRLGHGKGSYDTFLYRYRESMGSGSGSQGAEASERPVGKSFMRVYGLAFTEQYLPESTPLPTDEHDVPLDGLILEDVGLIRSGPV